MIVEVSGPGEWIVGPPDGARTLHVYRLSATDWLVSEVGRDNEGRGEDLTHALAALANGERSPDWWNAVEDALTLDGRP